jgi:hypothetical protein
MTDTIGTHLLRVERGRATDEELAALTVLLLARLGAHSRGLVATPQVRPGKLPRNGLDRAHPFRAAHSWQA